MRTSACLALMGVLAAAPALAQGATPAQGAAPRAGVGMQQVHLSPPLVVQVQRELQSQGLYTGKIDGEFGPATRQALVKFQSANRLRPTGAPDAATLVALRAQSAKAKQPATAAQQTPAQQTPAQQTPAQARAERLRAYQARNGASTRPGGSTAPGWAASAAPGQGAVSPLPPNSLTQTNGSLTGVTGAMTGAQIGAAAPAPRGFFGYSSNMSNGFNAATGK